MAMPEEDWHELVRAVREKDSTQVLRFGRCCAQAGLLERREEACACNNAQPCLAGPPHLLAAYHGYNQVLEELLAYASGDLIEDHASGWCLGCTAGGMTPLQLACSEGTVDCVRILLRMGASPAASCCFHVNAIDLPMEAALPSGGLSTYTALQLARHAGRDATATLLGQLGATSAPHPDSQCPICYELLAADDKKIETTGCGHRFHSACLPNFLSACPLCRAPMHRPKNRPAADGSPGNRLERAADNGMSSWTGAGSEGAPLSLLERTRLQMQLDFANMPVDRSPLPWILGNIATPAADMSCRNNGPH